MSENTLKMISENRDVHKNIQDVDLTIYPASHELIFRIIPAIQYDAYNEFKKLEVNSERATLCKKRLDAEKQINDETIAEKEGLQINYGDIIQLYHELTKSYVRFSSDRTDIKGTFKVSLSKEGFDETHFKVVPGINLVKEGQALRYSEKLSF